MEDTGRTAERTRVEKSEGKYFLENDYIRIGVIDPANLEDIHFNIRYSYCGYLLSIKWKQNGEDFLELPFSPFNAFHGEGFPDEFEIPLGYNDAGIGDEFIKIGVGWLQKTFDLPYSNWYYHPILKKAPIKTEVKDNSLIFEQSCQDSKKKYAYQYVKMIKIHDRIFEITHKLRNTGHVKWETLWYAHTFIKQQYAAGGMCFEPGADMVMDKPSQYFKPNHDGGLVNQRPLHPGESECIRYINQGNSPNTHRIADSKNKILYESKCSYVCHELQLYANDRIISPEPKLRRNFEPGEEYQWRNEYRIEKQSDDL